MLIGKALNNTKAVLNGFDSVEDALEQMQVLDATVLPVINATTNKLEGQVSLEMLKEAPLHVFVKDLELEEPIKVFAHQHLFRAIQWMLQYELNVLPVVDEQWVYQGVIFRQQVLESLGQMLNLNEYGSVITVRLEQHDFSLTEIVHIIETEEGKVLGITVETPNAEQQAYEVSIKINLEDASRVASALRRYGYLILTEADSGEGHFDLETRADALINYLDM